MKRTGAQLLIDILREEGVDTVFGYPGAAVIDIYDTLVASGIRHILVRHEQGAVHAADGYARSGGRVGVCLVTSGPGATNTVTGIASAWADSVPLVILTGQVPTHLIGTDAFQEVDITGITAPCTKHNYLVTDISHLPRVLREAFYIARTGRPGPVLVDIPKELGRQTLKPEKGVALQIPGYNPTYEPSRKQIRKATDLLRKSRRPLILAGGGVVCSKAGHALAAFATKTGIPVAVTLMGIGAFPGTDPLFLGMVGHLGSDRARQAVNGCDLLIAAGVRFDDWVAGRSGPFADGADIVHIDIDPTSIRKNVPVAVPVVGDCRVTLELMGKHLGEEDIRSFRDQYRPWREEIAAWPEPSGDPGSGGISSRMVVESLMAATGGGAVICADGGTSPLCAARYYRFDRPGQFVTPGGLGVTGFSLPAAIGAQLASPDRLVLGIGDDRGFQNAVQELATAVQYRIPVKLVVLNSGGNLGSEPAPSLRPYHAPGPDFVKLAEAFGAEGLKAGTPDQVMPVIEKGLAAAGPVLMEFRIDPAEARIPDDCDGWGKAKEE